MIQTQSKDYPEIVRSGGKIIVPYQIESYTDSEGNEGFQFYYCAVEDLGQDISDESVSLELIALVNEHSGIIPVTQVVSDSYLFIPYNTDFIDNKETLIFYVVTSPDNITKRHGQVVTLRLKQDNNGAYLDSIFNDCIQIYPRPGQPEDQEKVIVKVRFGTKMQAYLADQCGADNPFYDPAAVQMLDVYTQFFGSLETLKIVWPELWDLIDMEYVDEDGNTRVKQITKINLEHRWT